MPFDPLVRPVIGAILLAAGSSSRLGQPKQLLFWQGRSLLRHAADAALESGVSPTVVVLGSRAEEMMPEIGGLAVHTVVNPEWEAGMASSLQTGLRTLEQTAPLDAVLVLLCDQPLVTPDYLSTIVDLYIADPRLAVASQYEDAVLGPPCLFSRALFPDLKMLSGAQGARAVLGKLSPDEISLVPFPDGQVDVDTWDDWERLKEKKLI